MPDVSSLTSKGTTAAGLSISIASIRSSMVPFIFPGCAFFSGRACTVASTAPTLSLFVSLATVIAALPGVTRPCTAPVMSRKSKKTILPWSRRTDTHPLMRTDSPTCSCKSFMNVRSILNTYANFLTDVYHFLFCLFARSARPIFQNIFDVSIRQTCAFLAHRTNHRFNIFDECIFERLILTLVFGIECGERIFTLEQTVNVVNILGSLPCRVGDDTHNSLLNLIFCTKERDGVAIAFAHFLTIGTRNNRDGFENFLLR